LTSWIIGSVLVTCNCSFSSNLDPDTVKQVFLDRTQKATDHWLGDSYKLDDDLQVMRQLKKPVWGGSGENFKTGFIYFHWPYDFIEAPPFRMFSCQGQRPGQSSPVSLWPLLMVFSIPSAFFSCSLIPRLVRPRGHTGVDSLCDFTTAARVQSFDRAAIYEEFLRLTNNGTQLQNFTLDRNSVLVDGKEWSRRLGSCCHNNFLTFPPSFNPVQVTMCLRKKEGDYEVQRRTITSYLSHLDPRKIH
uniref:Uncharacterized protein n=1 Tax=Monodelphis domestica TaxID=13616 RepID=F6PHR9_MONDO